MLKKFLIFFFILLFAVSASADTYTVSQDGSGADYSVTTFNALSGSSYAGDTFYFSGNITTEVAPQIYGSYGNPIILDGYEAGNCDPLNSVCSSSALINTSTGGIEIQSGIDYITIQDFRITGSSGNYPLLEINRSNISGTSDHITIQRNYLYDAPAGLMSFGRDSNFDGSDYVTVIDNKMVGYGNIYDATQGVRWYYVTDGLIQNNVFGHGYSNCTSDNVAEVYSSTKLLFEYNEFYESYQQSGLSIKEPYAPNNCSNIIVRFNKFYDLGQSGTKESRGISIGGEAQYIYVYGNFIYDAGYWGMAVQRGANYVYLWSNIISKSRQAGLLIWPTDHDPHHIYFYNNTVSYCATDPTGSSDYAWTGIGLTENGLDDFFCKNNILYYNRPNASTYQQWVASSSNHVGELDTDYNTVYYPSQTPNFYYDGDYRTLATMQGTYSLETNSDITDPAFTDADGADNTYGTVDDDYTLDGTNIDDGEDLSGSPGNVTIQGTLYTLYFDDALDPNTTDWSTTPPTIGVLKQDDYDSWERGAYIYAAGTPNPLVVIDTPVGNQLITGSGSVSFSCTPSSGTAPYTYQWDENGSDIIGTASGDTVQDPGAKTYDTAGTYVVQVTVTDDNSKTATDTVTITVEEDTGTVIDNSGWSILFCGSEETVDESTPATNIIDGDPDTFWHTQWGADAVDIEDTGTYGDASYTVTSAASSRPGEFWLDLGADYAITQVRFTPRPYSVEDPEINGRFNGWYIYGIAAASGQPSAVADFGSAHDSGNLANSADVQTVALSSTLTARYIRVVCDTSYGSTVDEWASLGELILLTGAAETCDTDTDAEQWAPTAQDDDQTWGDTWTAQKFTTSEDIYITGYNIKPCDDNADTGSSTIVIMDHDSGNDQPDETSEVTGTTKTLAASALSDCATYDETFYELATPKLLSAGTYWVVHKCVSSADIRLSADGTSTGDRQAYSDDDGSTWTKADNVAFNVEIWGCADTVEAPVLIGIEYDGDGSPNGYYNEADTIGPWKAIFDRPVDSSSTRNIAFTGVTDTADLADPQPTGYGDGTQYIQFDEITIEPDDTSEDLAAVTLNGTYVASEDGITAAKVTMPSNNNTDDLYAIVVDTTALTYDSVDTGDSNYSGDDTYTTAGTWVIFPIQCSEAGTTQGAGTWPQVSSSGLLPAERNLVCLGNGDDNTVKLFGLLLQAGDYATDLGTDTTVVYGTGAVYDLAGNLGSTTFIDVSSTTAIVVKVAEDYTVSATGDYATLAALVAARGAVVPGDGITCGVGSLVSDTYPEWSYGSGESGSPISIDVTALTSANLFVVNGDYLTITKPAGMRIKVSGTGIIIGE